MKKLKSYYGKPRFFYGKDEIGYVHSFGSKRFRDDLCDENRIVPLTRAEAIKASKEAGGYKHHPSDWWTYVVVEGSVDR